MLHLLACISGILLGLYFKVLILVPVSLIGTLVFVFINLSAGLSPFSDLGSLVFPLVLGQVGYFLGLAGRDSLEHLLARSHPIESDRV